MPVPNTAVDVAVAENAAVAADITRRIAAGIPSTDATNLAIRQHGNDRQLDPVAAHVKLIKQGAVAASTFKSN